MTKERATMKAMAVNDNAVMTKMMVWAKKLPMQEMSVVAKMMRVDNAATRF